MKYVYLKPELDNLSQGERIVFVRQFRRLTQDNVSEKLEITGEAKRRTMTRYERGDRIPKKDRLLEIANILNVNLISSLETRKNRNRIRFENGGHYVSDDTMDNVYSKDIFKYTKTWENFGYLLVDERTIPVYTIVNDKTHSKIELNKFL